MELKHNSIKILFYIDSFSPISETFIYDQVVGISKSAEVLVVCLKRENSQVFPFDHVIKFEINEKSFLERLKQKLFRHNIYFSLKNYSFKKNLSKVFQSFQPDLIHCHFGIQAIRLIDNLKSNHRPIVITFHGYDASIYLNKYPVYVNRLKKIIQSKKIHPLSVSLAIQNNLISKQIKSDLHQVIYNGIDQNYFKRTNYNIETFTFLQISRLTEKKGTFYTIHAFKRLITLNPDFNCKLIIAGEGHLKLSLIREVSDLGLEHFVEFKGKVNRNEVKKLMDHANVFVQHSIISSDGDTEGLPMTIMEAMSMELPILSTYHSGIPELVEDGVNGFLVKEKNIEAYAQKMNDMITWGYQKQNREKIINRFSLDLHLKNILQYYHSIIG